MKTYKLRKAESTLSPKLVEYLQGGILIRFNIKKTTRKNEDGSKNQFFEYDEFWFDPKTANIADVVKANGFVLTKKHIQLLKG